ncbi:unnamed protein product [marine sediment metagenome]|uniref:Uncharacterized protein n=1 Tax=marine sediment metagenome TaxID=412755 RepID=X1GZA1_9ZZZZ
MENIRYLKIVLEKELRNAASSISDMSDYAQKKEAEEHIQGKVIDPIKAVLKEFDLKFGVNDEKI